MKPVFSSSFVNRFAGGGSLENLSSVSFKLCFCNDAVKSSTESTELMKMNDGCVFSVVFSSPLLNPRVDCDRYYQCLFFNRCSCPPGIRIDLFLENDSDTIIWRKSS